MPTSPRPPAPAVGGGANGSPELGPWSHFTDAATTMVQQLATHAPLDLWLVTRTRDGSQVAVAAAGRRTHETTVETSARQRDPHVARAVAELDAAGPTPAVRLHPCVAIPLVLHDGSLRGWLFGSDHTPGGCVGAGAIPFAELAGRTLSTVLDVEETARERGRELSLARALAELDALTGIPNRRGWEAGLARERRAAPRRHPLAVLVLDLDDLKEVNDALGHARGDALLFRCASVLRTTCRVSDVLARLGGDEFAVLARLDPAGTEEMVRRLRGELTAAGVAASIGAAVQEPGEDLSATWRRADAAMYRDKRVRRTPAAGCPTCSPRSSPEAAVPEPLPGTRSAGGRRSPRAPAPPRTGGCAMPPRPP